MENWMPVVGFSDYEVSDLGRVRSVDRVVTRSGHQMTLAGKVLKPGRRVVRGYASHLVVLRRDGKSHTLTVHRLVLEAFVGPRPDGMECCHENDDATDNRLVNLRWGTHESNMADMATRGRSGMAKLTCDQVREIRASLSAGELQRSIASRFGVSQPTVKCINLGQTWAHVV